MTDHPVLTLETVRDVAAEIVKDSPMKVVAICTYAHPQYEGPSCLVGAILYKLGWTYQELREFDRGNNTDGESTISSLVLNGDIDADEFARTYLASLQTLQDSGIFWLEVYRTTEKRYGQ